MCIKMPMHVIKMMNLSKVAELNWGFLVVLQENVGILLRLDEGRILEFIFSSLVVPTDCYVNYSFTWQAYLIFHQISTSFNICQLKQYLFKCQVLFYIPYEDTPISISYNYVNS